MANQPQQDIRERSIFVRRDWLVVSMLALVVALLWIGLSVYKVLNTSTIPGPEQKRLKLFSTDFDDGVIAKLGEKKQVIGSPIDEAKRVILIREDEKAVSPIQTLKPTGAPTSFLSPTPTTFLNPSPTETP